MDDNDRSTRRLDDVWLLIRRPGTLFLDIGSNSTPKGKLFREGGGID